MTYQQLRLTRLQRLINSQYNDLAKAILDMIVATPSPSLTDTRGGVKATNFPSVTIPIPVNADIVFFLGEFSWYLGVQLKIQKELNSTTIYIAESNVVETV